MKIIKKPINDHNKLTDVLGHGVFHLSETERDNVVNGFGYYKYSSTTLPAVAQYYRVAELQALTGGSGKFTISGFFGGAYFHIQVLFEGRPTDILMEVDSSVVNTTTCPQGIGILENGGTYYIGVKGNGAFVNTITNMHIDGNGITPLELTDGSGDTVIKESILAQRLAEKYLGSNTANGKDYVISNLGGLLTRVTKEGNYGVGVTPTARIHAKASTSDSSSFVKKKEDNTGKLLSSLRADGLKFHNGGKVERSQVYTASATLTEGSPSVAIASPTGAGMVLTGVLSPSDDLEFDLVNPSAYDVTIGRNSELIYGAASNITLLSGAKIKLHYVNSTIGWV